MVCSRREMARNETIIPNCNCTWWNNFEALYRISVLKVSSATVKLTHDRRHSAGMQRPWQLSRCRPFKNISRCNWFRRIRLTYRWGERRKVSVKCWDDLVWLVCGFHHKVRKVFTARTRKELWISFWIRNWNRLHLTVHWTYLRLWRRRTRPRCLLIGLAQSVDGEGFYAIAHIIRRKWPKVCVRCRSLGGRRPRLYTPSSNKQISTH